MEWKEKLGLVSLSLALIVWGLCVLGEWSFLVSRLTPIRWVAITGFHFAALLLLIGMYVRAPKGTPARRQSLQVAVVVILTWSADFVYLIGKVGGH
jgi:hypothetical protein